MAVISRNTVLLLYLTCSIVAAQVSIRRSPQGIIGVKHGTVQIIGGYWRVYVVIDKPDVPRLTALNTELNKSSNTP